MTAINSTEALIEFHEGRKPRLYRDEFGKNTIGVGRCLDTNPLRDSEIDFLRDNDIRAADETCQALFPGWGGFGAQRQAALRDMAFELGEHGLAAFNGMRLAIEADNWDAAAKTALNSLWARQVPGRAMMDAEMLRSGQWPDAIDGA